MWEGKILNDIKLVKLLIRNLNLKKKTFFFESQSIKDKIGGRQRALNFYACYLPPGLNNEVVVTPRTQKYPYCLRPGFFKLQNPEGPLKYVSSETPGKRYPVQFYARAPWIFKP